MPAMGQLQPQPTNTLDLAAPALSGAVQQPPASYMPCHKATFGLMLFLCKQPRVSTACCTHFQLLAQIWNIITFSEASSSVIIYVQHGVSSTASVQEHNWCLITQIFECNHHCTTDSEVKRGCFKHVFFLLGCPSPKKHKMATLFWVKIKVFLRNTFCIVWRE